MATSATPVKSNAEIEIERLSFTYTEVAQYDLSKIDPSKIQVREGGHYAPKESVERYAVQMGQSAFPPIVVTKDGYLVDGNTRVAARRLRKDAFCPAFVLEVDFGTASAKDKDKLVALAATLNMQNGQSLTGVEARRVTRSLIALGWNTENIARALGVAPNTVTMIKKEIEAEAKLKRVGLGSGGDLRGASLRALGAKDVLALNDEPYRELAELAADAGFNAAEITSAAKTAREAGSDAGALAVIAGLRTESKVRIEERKLTGVNKPPMSRQLRQHLGFVDKFVGREQELVESNSQFAAQHIDALNKAIMILTTVRELQTV